VLWVKALWERVSEEKLRIETPKPLKFEISEVESPEGIVVIDPWETRVRRSCELRIKKYFQGKRLKFEISEVRRPEVSLIPSD
jgi:hypothetical protein